MAARAVRILFPGLFLIAGLIRPVAAQNPGPNREGPPAGGQARLDGPEARPAPEARPGGPGPGPGGAGPGGFGGMMREETKLVERFDRDGDKRLDAAERKAAREFIQKERAAGRRPGGFGGRGGFGPGMLLAPQILSQADKDADQKVSKEELVALAEAWFARLDTAGAGKLTQAEFTERWSGILPPPQASGGPGGGPPGGRRFLAAGGPVGPGIFTAADGDKDGSLTQAELKDAFAGWFARWDTEKSNALTEESLRQGLNTALPQPAFGGPRGPGFFGRNENREPPRPGPSLSPAEVKSFPDAALYDPQTLRTFFLEFEAADWEKELADFKNTDVEVPAKVTVDGKTYQDVGIHFRGMSSFGVGEGRKRSLNLSLDFVHKEQHLGGYRTLNLLNAHEDPTFLRAALYYQIAREYIPTPKVNFARVVINGESWGIYVNAQQFNREFLKDWFGTTRGARWKVPGSPGGRGSLAYLGEDVAAYKRIYEIKSKDDPEAWAGLIKLCKVLKETPPERLEEALAPLLDIDGALKFLALENVLINNDGYWIRTSDYNLYQDKQGVFHLIPHDTNETFSRPGGPGFGGGGGGFGRGALAQHILSEADKNADRKLTREELGALADAWFDRLDPDRAGKLSQEQFTQRIDGVLPSPRDSGPPNAVPAPPPAPAAREPGPGVWVGPGIFRLADADKDGSLTRAELKGAFSRWVDDWAEEAAGALTEEALAGGLRATLSREDFVVVAGAPGGPNTDPGRPEPGPNRPDPGSNRQGVAPGPGGPGGPPGTGAGPGFGGGGPRVNGVELDPLVAANDANKPLLSRLLAVPALRERYLRYVRDIAETWLDWNKLGPIAERYHALIADDVKVDTRKLDTTEEFAEGLAGEAQPAPGPGPRGALSLKSFAEQRRAYLLKYEEKK